jgi:hypothetical protein
MVTLSFWGYLLYVEMSVRCSALQLLEKGRDHPIRMRCSVNVLSQMCALLAVVLPAAYDPVRALVKCASFQRDDAVGLPEKHTNYAPQALRRQRRFGKAG